MDTETIKTIKEIQQIADSLIWKVPEKCQKKKESKSRYKYKEIKY